MVSFGGSDWVTARHNRNQEKALCTGEKAFYELLERVRFDIDKINEIRCDVDFYLVENPGLFIVKAECKNAEELGSVKFKLNTHKIYVESSTDPENIFFVTWHWDDENAACVLQVNREDKDAGEISQMALESMFFTADDA